MWKYQNTDELYHAKYIKREWKNGRWHYYYDNAQLRNAQNKNVDASRALTRSKTNIYNLNNKKINANKVGDTSSVKKYNSELQKENKIRDKAYKNSVISQYNLYKAEDKDKKMQKSTKGVIKVANTVSDTKYKAKKKINKAIKILNKKK